MRPMIRWTAIVALCGLLAGCATHDEHKQAAFERWEKSTAQNKLATVDSLIERGRLDEAQQTLQQCLAAEPESAQAHFLMGRVHFIENRNEQARLSFAEAIALDASLDAAWYHLGVLSFLEGNTVRAMDAYQTALKLKPAETHYIVSVAQLYVHSGQADAAEELLSETVRRQPRNRDLLIALADLYQRSARLDRAISLYEQVLLTHPKDIDVLGALGYCYIAMDDWDGAMEVFGRLFAVVGDGPQQAAMLDTLALCTFNAGRYGQALRHYDRLSLLRRDDPGVWLNMAQAALGAEMVDRAADNARRALQLKPGWPQALAVLGSARYLRGDYDGALETFGRILRDEQIGGFAWFMTGRCYMQLGRTAQAEAAYERAGQHFADSPLVTRFLRVTDQEM